MVPILAKTNSVLLDARNKLVVSSQALSSLAVYARVGDSMHNTPDNERVITAVGDVICKTLGYASADDAALTTSLIAENVGLKGISSSAGELSTKLFRVLADSLTASRMAMAQYFTATEEAMTEYTRNDETKLTAIEGLIEASRAAAKDLHAMPGMKLTPEQETAYHAMRAPILLTKDRTPLSDDDIARRVTASSKPSTRQRADMKRLLISGADGAAIIENAARTIEILKLSTAGYELTGLKALVELFMGINSIETMNKAYNDSGTIAREERAKLQNKGGYISTGMRAHTHTMCGGVNITISPAKKATFDGFTAKLTKVNKVDESMLRLRPMGMDDYKIVQGLRSECVALTARLKGFHSSGEKLIEIISANQGKGIRASAEFIEFQANSPTELTYKDAVRKDVQDLGQAIMEMYSPIKRAQEVVTDVMIGMDAVEHFIREAFSTLTVK